MCPGTMYSRQAFERGPYQACLDAKGLARLGVGLGAHGIERFCLTQPSQQAKFEENLFASIVCLADTVEYARAQSSVLLQYMYMTHCLKFWLLPNKPLYVAGLCVAPSIWGIFPGL